jgi:Leucine-rich repeat (LRR) protein
LVLDETLLSFLRLISFDGGAALDDPTSPQYSAFLWLSQDPNLADFENERRTQRYAMATLYYSLNGESWLRNDGWLSEDDECTWFSQISRQICGPRRLQSGRPSRHPGSGSMIRLVLYYNNLEGVIPPEIALLTHLEEIHLMGGPTNYISGSIPSELGYLVNLRDVQLADNRLTGVLPSTLEAWHEIQYLDLSKNALSGSLTNEVVGGWFELTELHLSSNRFTGPMPLTWAQSLVFLELDNNILTGPLPASMGNLPELRLLSLDYNRFTSLPSDLVSLIVLEDFSIVGNELAGPLMPELGFLPQLRSLRLSNNTLTSTIPTEFGELARLISVLDLSNNELEGAIPSELGQINDRLRSLRLAGNRLSGPLPASLASLNRLAEIRLEDNDLTGAVPSEVCDVWYEELPTVYADCGEIDCPCCNFCCIDGEGCLCRYADDPELAWRCY